MSHKRATYRGDSEAASCSAHRTPDDGDEKLPGTLHVEQKAPNNTRILRIGLWKLKETRILREYFALEWRSSRRGNPQTANHSWNRWTQRRDRQTEGNALLHDDRATRASGPLGPNESTPEHIPLGSRLLSERLTQLGGFDQIKPAWSDTAEFYDGGKFVYVGGKHVGSAKWWSEKQLYVMELADNQSTHETRSFTTHTHSSLMAKPKGNSLIPRVDKDVLHARFTCAATVWDPSTSHDDSDGSTPLHDPRRCKTSTCFICKMAKSKRSPITRAGTPIDRSSDGFKPGQHLYWDPMGRLAEDTIEGHKYFVMSGDCTTKYQCITMTSAKSDFLDALVEFINHTETQSGNKCQMLTCDNELAHHTKFIALTKQRGFEVDLTEVGRSDQNPFAESANATIQKDIRVLLLLGRQPQNMASYAARYALYVRNRTPDRPDGTSRLERLTGRPQRVDHIRVYGCLVIYHVRGRGGDFTSRGSAGTFVGIQGKHYLIFDNDSMQLKRLDIIRTNSVAFVERRPGWLVTNAQLAQERRIHLSDDGTLPWADQLFTSFPWNELTAAPEHTVIARKGTVRLVQRG